MMVLLVADLERAPFFMRERECSTCLLDENNGGCYGTVMSSAKKEC